MSVLLAHSPGDAKMLERALGVTVLSDPSRVPRGEEVIVIYPRSQYRKAKGVAKMLTLYRGAYARVLDMDALGQPTVRDLIDAYGYEGVKRIIEEGVELAKPLTRREVAAAMVRGMEAGLWAAWELGTQESRVLYAILVAAARPRPEKSLSAKVGRRKLGNPVLRVRRLELLRTSPIYYDDFSKFISSLESKGYVTVTGVTGGYRMLIHLDRLRGELFGSLAKRLPNDSSPLRLVINSARTDPKVRLPFYDDVTASPSFLVMREKNLPLGGPKEVIPNDTHGKQNTPRGGKIPMPIGVTGFTKAEWSPRHAFAFMLLNNGASVRLAARVVGVAPSTLLRWIGRWSHAWRHGSRNAKWIVLSYVDRLKVDLARMPKLMRAFVYHIGRRYYPFGWLRPKTLAKLLYGFP